MWLWDSQRERWGARAVRVRPGAAADDDADHDELWISIDSEPGAGCGVDGSGRASPPASAPAGRSAMGLRLAALLALSFPGADPPPCSPGSPSPCSPCRAPGREITLRLACVWVQPVGF